MKHLFILATIMFVLTSCSRSEEPRKFMTTFDCLETFIKTKQSTFIMPDDEYLEEQLGITIDSVFYYLVFQNESQGIVSLQFPESKTIILPNYMPCQQYYFVALDTQDNKLVHEQINNLLGTIYSSQTGTPNIIAACTGTTYCP